MCSGRTLLRLMLQVDITSSIVSAHLAILTVTHTVRLILIHIWAMAAAGIFNVLENQTILFKTGTALSWAIRAQLYQTTI
jgi:hypothetical protein